MRLLNVRTLNFSEFPGTAPPYAIASHRWGNDEASYLDLLNGTNLASAGYRKVLGFCEFVQSVSLPSATGGCQTLDWIWIDSCCIDRQSSAELDEAINSMKKWYVLASLCVVYLQDVRSLDCGIDAVLLDFQSSTWFKRGWTLQELIFPKRLVFTTCAWDIIGTKGSLEIDRLGRTVGDVTPPCNDRREDLLLLLHQLTRITSDILSGLQSVSSASEDQRWSWLARRDTTRPEDMVYCMLGIFEISLDPRYGEGYLEARQRFEAAIKRKRSRVHKKPSPVPRLTQSERDSSTIHSSPAQINVKRWLTEPGVGSIDAGFYGYLNLSNPIVSSYIQQVFAAPFEVTATHAELLCLMKYPFGRHCAGSDEIIERTLGRKTTKVEPITT